MCGAAGQDPALHDEKDLARLGRWHERAILAASIIEGIDEPI
jgi:hypothetical protein